MHCWNDSFRLPDAIIRTPPRDDPLPEHKNPDFVLGRGKNLRKIARSDTKTPILCLKSPKTGVPKAKKAQKPRFCAREDGDWQWEEKILASESATVAFLQITAHASKIQIPHNQIINFYQRAR